MAGDDLQDDFILDDIVALSDIESELESEQSEQQLSQNKPESSSETAVKRKRRQKEKERKAKKRKFKDPHSDETPFLISTCSSDIIYDFISKSQSTALSELSSIELEEWKIPPQCIADTTCWSGPRSLEFLPEFIAKTLPSLKTRLAQRPKHLGAPTLIFIAAAALRVADITRILKQMKYESGSAKAGEIAKLFAKHFKLEEHARYLKQTRVGAAVGTPGRIGRLLTETDSLSVSALSHIVIDTTFRDAKKRSIFDIPETKQELFRYVLGAAAVRRALTNGSLTLVLF